MPRSHYDFGRVNPTLKGWSSFSQNGLLRTGSLLLDRAAENLERSMRPRSREGAAGAYDATSLEPD